MCICYVLEHVILNVYYYTNGAITAVLVSKVFIPLMHTGYLNLYINI